MDQVARPMAIAVLVLLACSDPCLAAKDRPLAINDVSVLNMRTGRWAEHQAVLVADGRIQKIVPSAGWKPATSQLVIDGSGRFLIPGLIDSHVHLFSPDDLAAYVANGVTTVVNMSGTPEDLALRDKVRSGKLRGPRIYTAGPTIDGYPPLNELFATAETPEQGRAIVRSHQRAGYDFIKVYGTLRPETFRAIAAECARARMMLAGHVNRQFDLSEVMGSGQALAAHAEDLIFARFHEPPERSRLEEFAKQVARSGITVTANLAISPNVERQITDLDAVLASADGQSLSAAAYSQWIRSNNRNLDRDPAEHVAELEKAQKLLVEFVGLLHKERVPLVLGSDAASYGFPGASVAEELMATQRAGLSPLEALRSATSNAGAFISRHLDARATLGTIEAGATADLILLKADPLADLAGVSAIDGVVLGGRWVPRVELDVARRRTRERLRREHRLVDEIDRSISAGDIASARRKLDAARAPSPLFAEWVLHTKARKLADRLPVAVALAELGVHQYPRSFSAHLLLADLLFKAQRPGEAEASARRALRLQPDNAVTANLLEKISSSSRPVTFEAGSYKLELISRDGSSSPVRLELTHGDGGWRGVLLDGGNSSPLQDVTAGGNRLWFRAGSGWTSKELKLSLAKDGAISGYWWAMFGRNGAVRGSGEQPVH